MDPNKEKLLQEAYNRYIEMMLYDFPIDRMEDYVVADVNGYGTTLDEKILDIKRLRQLVTDMRDQGAGMEMHFNITPISRRISHREDTAIFMDEIDITMIAGGDKNVISLRLSSIFEFGENGWKLVHLHGSLAVQVEGDTWHKDEWKRKNEALQKLVDERTSELKTSIENLKAAQSQLIHAEKMASLGELTAGIAHEIQNPLNFVNNFSEVSVDLIKEMNEEMEKGNSDNVKDITGDLKQNLEIINHHGKRASSIVKGMLEHSRTSAGQKELTDINVLADEYLRLAYHGLRAKDKTFNADFKTELDESLPKIKVIPQDISRVLLNLINNAFYAVSSKNLSGFSNLTGLAFKPLVIVSTKKLDDKIEIRVKDNGGGIPKNVIDKIFQPFFTTKPTGQGTGLGLSLSYDIIKAHDGELQMETKEGEGTEFIIILPGKEKISIQ